MTTEQRLANSLGIDFAIKQIPIGSYQINYLVAGKGEPLLLIHGANFGWGVWYPNIPKLAQHFTVYAIDLPGAGHSSLIDYAKLDVRQDFVEVTKQFILGEKLHGLSVVGHSIGGYVALKLAIEQREEIKKIALIDSTGFADAIHFPEILLTLFPITKLIANSILNPRRENIKLEKFLRSAFFDKEIILKNEFLDYFYEGQHRSHNLLLVSHLLKHRKSLSLKSELPDVSQNVLLIWGANDKIMPLSDNKGYFQLLPHAQVEIFQDTGHVPTIEKPQKSNDKIMQFLHTN